MAAILAASDADEATRAQCCRLLVSFGWWTKSTLRYETTAKEISQALLHPDQLEAVVQSKKQDPENTIQKTKTTDATKPI